MTAANRPPASDSGQPATADEDVPPFCCTRRHRRLHRVPTGSGAGRSRAPLKHPIRTANSTREECRIGPRHGPTPS